MRTLRLIPLLLLLASPALGQIESREAIALQNQILELRRDLHALQARVGPGPALAAPVPVAPPRPGTVAEGQQELLSRLLDRVAALETELRLLRGRSDETQNTLRELQATVEKNQADLDFRLQELEGAAPRRPAPQAAAPAPPAPAARPAAPPASPPAALPRPPAAPAAAPAARPQAQILTAASAALGRRDWAAAEREAGAFIATYPRDPRVGEAYHIRAQALSGRGEHLQAVLAFDDARGRVADRARRQDILLGLGRSLGAIDERASACEVFRQLASDFHTDMRADVREALERERSRLRC
jgi:TolA-binding protein